MAENTRFALGGIVFRGANGDHGQFIINDLMTGQKIELPLNDPSKFDEIIAEMSPLDAFSVGIHYRRVAT
jgi:hypothetical protein